MSGWQSKAPLVACQYHLPTRSFQDFHRGPGLGFQSLHDKQAFGNGGVQVLQSGQQCFEAGQGFGFQDFRNDQGLGHGGNPQGLGRGRGRGSGGSGSNDFL